VVKENTKGLTYARRRGVCESQYEYIIFCDDDNWLADNYIEVAFNLFNQNPDIGVIGGSSSAVYDGVLPAWFYSKSECYAVGEQGEEAGDISKRGYVWGAGMCVRRSVLLSMYNNSIKHLLTGRIGNKSAAGDDSEICEWFQIAGFKLWFDSRLNFMHFIPVDRVSLDYLSRIEDGFVNSRPILLTYMLMRKGYVSNLPYVRKFQCNIIRFLSIFFAEDRKSKLRALAGAIDLYGDRLSFNIKSITNLIHRKF
jgi:glycosyltransferase involved in cell wall biosynthesis